MSLKRLLIILSIVLSILLIPFIAMFYSEEVRWDLADFLIMGVLLFTAGLALDYVIRKNSKKKVFLIVSIVLIFLLTWAELAVGILGTPFAGSQSKPLAKIKSRSIAPISQ